MMAQTLSKEEDFGPLHSAAVTGDKGIIHKWRHAYMGLPLLSCPKLKCLCHKIPPQLAFVWKSVQTENHCNQFFKSSYHKATDT